MIDCSIIWVFAELSESRLCDSATQIVIVDFIIDGNNAAAQQLRNWSKLVESDFDLHRDPRPYTGSVDRQRVVWRIGPRRLGPECPAGFHEHTYKGGKRGSLYGD